jgi:hypothetical protein
MSTLKVDAIVDSSAGNTTTINGTTPTAYNTMGRNRIINGAMEIDQRNAGASVTPTNGQYCLDRWQNAVNVSSKYSCQQVSDAPAGFTYSLKATSLSAYTIGANEIAGFRQYIEGYNISDLGFGTADAKTITLSFWVKSSLTGTFGGVVSNDSGRTWAFTYTISSADTWEQKSITVSGDTTGTWLTTNGKGLSVIFSLACGSSYAATPEQWTSANRYGATGQSSVLATNAATWQVTGVQLEVGSVATEFERRPYGTELQLCYRYFQKFLGSSTYEALPSYVIAGTNTTMAEGFFAHKCTMRAVPSFSISTLCLLDATNVYAMTGITLNAGGLDSSRVIYTGMTGLTTHRSYYPTAYNSTSAYVYLSAEL